MDMSDEYLAFGEPKREEAYAYTVHLNCDKENVKVDIIKILLSHGAEMPPNVNITGYKR
jgi:hypothetical protein